MYAHNTYLITLLFLLSYLFVISLLGILTKMGRIKISENGKKTYSYFYYNVSEPLLKRELRSIPAEVALLKMETSLHFLFIKAFFKKILYHVLLQCTRVVQ